MRRATITVPPQLEDELESFMGAQPARPSLTSVVEAALTAYLNPRDKMESSRLVDVVRSREAIRGIGVKHGATRIGLFGSVANGTDTPASDVDIWVETAPNVTLFDLAAMRSEFTTLLGCPVDVLTLEGLPQSEREALVNASLVL
ncbi:nucleotidyltransferase family protein [Demequina aurantiaca]|uniref:nucleotidyltransferase family protein n=1 Tax=Demequina aurantiaca TaxID=676200 RepID=UPI003D3485C9